MKKIGLITVLLLAMLMLFACSSGETDIPAGMQIVYGGEAAGYYFYAPEEWTVSNIGEVKTVYVSRLDRTSMSFCEISKDTLTDSPEEYFFGSYFNDSLSEFPDSTEVTLSASPEPFGKEGEAADKARKYEYNYTYGKEKYGFVQYLIMEGDRFFIFTYTAKLEQRADGDTYFKHYLDRLETVVNNFRFVTKTESSEEKIEYQKDSDGYILISDKNEAKFELYVPDSFIPDYSSGIVSATHSDGSNVNMTQVATTGVDIQDGYWKMRKEDLAKIVDNLHILKEIDRSEQTDFGNAYAAFACEYTYDYNGKSYHVYQIFCVDSQFMGYGYALTYTASEENYQAHLAELMKIIEKVRF